MDSDDLLSYAKGLGIRVVRQPSKKMYGYEGLHWRVDRKLGLSIPVNEVWIDKNLHGRAFFRTLNHELIEISRMSDGASYWVAHRFATRHEVDDNFLF